MNLPEPQSLTFSSIMNSIETGAIKIPQFQRDFVWSKEKSAKLLDSIVKGYPIGTFIFWKTKEELRVLRDLGGLELPPTPKGDFIQYVIDGQQRLTTLFASLKGLKIQREDHEDDYAEFYVDLKAKEDEPMVLTALPDNGQDTVIKLHDLLYGKIKLLSSYTEPLQDRIQSYKDRINAYQFATVLVKEVSIDVATEIFTRLNVGGKPLSVFEIMVARTFDQKRNFDMAEKYEELVTELVAKGFGSLPESVVLQTLSVVLCKECRKKDILGLPKKRVVDAWPEAVAAIKDAVDHFRDSYRIPVSNLLPYPNMVVPFAYYFYKTGQKPTGDIQTYLQDFFWRAALGGRYSMSVESRLAQDVLKIDKIIKEKLPDYDWAVDTSPEFVEKNGWFSVNRSYIKALLCILAYRRPKSFEANADVRISNDWLRQANSKNYHHFFPKSYLKKKGEADARINHIANITIVDDDLNKREIKAQAPSKYMKRFAKHNPQLAGSMKTHLIDLDTFGIFEDDYDKFISKRCKAFSKELRKRIIEQDIDRSQTAIPAKDSAEPEME